MDAKGTVRVSLSLPQDVFEGLEELVKERGTENRSLLVSDILRQEILLHRRSKPETVMAGTISLFYDETRPGLQQRVAAIQRAHLKEVVASLGVMLEEGRRMDVLVVQGPVRVLDELMKELNSCRGMESSRLTLSSAVLPPLHDKVDEEEFELQEGTRP